MLIDTLGERYGMLPSEVVQRATTFDVFVADTAIGYRNKLQERANNGGVDKFDATQYTEADLLKIMEETRGKS